MMVFQRLSPTVRFEALGLLVRLRFATGSGAPGSSMLVVSAKFPSFNSWGSEIESLARIFRERDLDRGTVATAWYVGLLCCGCSFFKFYVDVTWDAEAIGESSLGFRVCGV